jgi:hypothetical protein
MASQMLLLLLLVNNKDPLPPRISWRLGFRETLAAQSVIRWSRDVDSIALQMQVIENKIH